MEIQDLVGSWKKYDKGATWSATTTYIFKINGTYKKHEESNGMAGSSYFEEQGKFKISGPFQIEIVSEAENRSVLSLFSLGRKVT